MPIIPADLIADSAKGKVAHKCTSAMKPSLLKTLDKHLWAAWEPIATAVEISEADMHKSFRIFLDEEYFNIMCQTCASSTIATLPFEPLVEPEIGATPTEADLRRGILERATSQDHEFAAADVEKYTEFLATCSSTARQMYPEVAPQKYAARRYYNSLRQRLDEAGGTDPVSRQNSAPSVDALAGKSCETNGIDMILDGHMSRSSTLTTEKMEHKSALDIL